jgi:hypothetical protein
MSLGIYIPILPYSLLIVEPEGYDVTLLLLSVS